MSNISYDSKDAARLAELLLAAGRAAEIPRYLRQGVLPEMVERELAKPSNSATSRYSSARDTNAALEKAANFARDIAPELERRLPREEGSQDSPLEGGGFELPVRRHR